jgi:hypothetical protein
VFYVNAPSSNFSSVADVIPLVHLAPVILSGFACGSSNPAGDAQGGGSPLVGGAGRTMRASGFGWIAACSGVGEPARPGFSPGRGKRERGRSNSLLPQANSSSCFALSIGSESDPS